MFEHNERTNFLDLLRPPTEYRLESAIGTTYSLDFVALTGTLLALIDADEGDQTGPVHHIDTLHAITRLADRLRVFVNRGRISGPNQVSRVTALYDRIIREVALPEDAFHPKVWVLHYQPRLMAGSEMLPGLVRVMCASRNLTTSQHWEAFIATEGRVVQRKVNELFNTDLKGFIQRLMAHDQESSPRIALLADTIARTTFNFPRLMQRERRFLWQWPEGEALQDHLPHKARRALVVSPFVRKTFLESIVKRVEKLTVVSTQRELDKITDDAFVARLCGAGNRVYVVQPPDTDGEPVMELHAKLLVFEDDHASLTFLGSANTSNSGWGGRNCEVVIAGSPGVSIDHLCDRFVFGETPAPRGGKRPLRGWISEYQRQPYVEDEHERADRYLEEICAALARLILLATYDKEERVLRVRVDTPPPQLASELAQWESECESGIALLSQLHSDTAFQPLSNALAKEVIFLDVGVADLTEFLVIDLVHRQQGNHKRFIVKAKAVFSEWKDDRDTALVQQLVNRDSVRSLFQAILFDATLRPLSSSGGGTGEGKGEKGKAPLLSDLTVEDVLRSCTEDPSRIEEINHLIKTFEKSDFIDDEFRRFWNTFVAAEEAARHG